MRMPERVRSAVLGSPNRPTRLANAIHSFLNRLPGERFPVVACHGPLEGCRMRLDWHLHRSFMYGTWEPEVVKAISAEVQRGSVVADIGAHIGYYTLLLARLVGPQGIVYAFEPVPENFEALSENIRLNHCDWAKPLQMAVLEHAGHVEVSVPAGEPFPETASVARGQGGQRKSFGTISVDEFVAESHAPISFIKLDAEGAEEQILRGARETIASAHPTWLVELHQFDAYGERHPALTQLRESGYDIRWLNRWEYNAHILARWPAVSGLEV